MRDSVTVSRNSFDPNGVTKGVSIAEFHYENGGVRPVQVTQTLTINNGPDAPNAVPTSSTMGVRSARLDLKLDSAPLAPGGVPESLGLIDVDWSPDDLYTGSITGTGDLDGDGSFIDDRVFSNANAADPLAASAGYFQDSIVSAIFGSTKYNWKISYTGSITWSDVANSVVGSVSATGGLDVVLIGDSIESISVGLPGDYNNDHIVNAADYTVWRNHLNVASEASLNGNGDGSGTVDVGDYTRWKAHFGESSGPGAGSLGASQVPEPSAILLSRPFGAGIARRSPSRCMNGSRILLEVLPRQPVSQLAAAFVCCPSVRRSNLWRTSHVRGEWRHECKVLNCVCRPRD